AFGTLANFNTLRYTNFYAWATATSAGDVEAGITNKPAVCHLKTDDIYFSVTFTKWGRFGSGGFAYTRSTPAAVAPTPTVSVINPVSVSLSTPVISNGQVSFNYSADPGLRYVVQSTSDFITWNSGTTNAAAVNPVTFTEAAVPDFRFYSVARLPNP